MITSNVYPERFKSAINKLVKAYFNGTLKAGNCEACAVGNICDGSSEWSRIFVSSVSLEGKYQIIAEPGEIVLSGLTGTVIHSIYSPFVSLASLAEYAKGLRDINKTGYSVKELARVEEAFERNADMYTNTPESQYKGLMAVVEVLCDIEGIEEISEIKELFTATA